MSEVPVCFSSMLALNSPVRMSCFNVHALASGLTRSITTTIPIAMFSPFLRINVQNAFPFVRSFEDFFSCSICLFNRSYSVIYAHQTMWNQKPVNGQNVESRYFSPPAYLTVFLCSDILLAIPFFLPNLSLHCPL